MFTPEEAQIEDGLAENEDAPIDANEVNIELIAESSEDDAAIDLFCGDQYSAGQREQLLARLEDLGVDAGSLAAFCRDSIRCPNPLPTNPAVQTLAIGTAVSEFVELLQRRGARVYAVQQALQGAASELATIDDHERRRKHEQASDEDQQS